MSFTPVFHPAGHSARHSAGQSTGQRELKELDTIAEGVPPELIEGTSLLKKNKTIVTDIKTLKENNLTIIATCLGLNMNSPKNKNSSCISTSYYQTLNSYGLSGNDIN